MKKKLIIIIFAFLFLVNVSAFLTILYNSFSSKETDKPSAIKEMLNLTELQAKEIEDIRVSFKNEAENIGLKLREKQQELILSMRKENPDKEHIYNLIDEISLIQAELQKQAIEKMLQEKTLLNPNQQEMYFSMCGQRLGYGKMEGRGGRGFMRGRGRGMGRGGQQFWNQK